MKKVTNILTLEEVKRTFSYNPGTGELTYLEGSPINFIVNDRGYKMVRHKGAFYGAARICLTIVTGTWPLGLIEYKDGNLANLAEKNLKEIPHNYPTLEPGERRAVRFLDPSKVKEVLEYNKETGELTWKITRGRKSKGESAGYVSGAGYRLIQVFGTIQSAQRIAYMIVHGKSPNSNCRFKDGNPLNLRWDNLIFNG